MKTYLFRVVVEPDDGRWVAYAPALKKHGGATWGQTQGEALRSIREVLQMTVESMLEHGEHIPEDPQADVQVFEEPQVAVTL